MSLHIKFNHTFLTYNLHQTTIGAYGRIICQRLLCLRPGSQYRVNAGTLTDYVQFLHAFSHITSITISDTSLCIIQIQLTQTNDRQRISQGRHVVRLTGSRSRMNPFLIQITGWRVVISSVHFATVVFLLVLCQPSFALFTVGTVHFILISNTFGTVGYYILRLTFVKAIMERYPGIETRLTMIVQFQSYSLSACIIIQNSSLKTIFIVIRRVLVNRKTIFGIESFYHCQRRTISSSKRKIRNGFILYAIHFFQAGICPKYLLSSVLVQVCKTQLSLDRIFRIRIGGCTNGIIANVI